MALFIHPLSPLTEAQFIDGVSQVVTLAENYGTSYTSTNLVFGEFDSVCALMLSIPVSH